MDEQTQSELSAVDTLEQGAQTYPKVSKQGTRPSDETKAAVVDFLSQNTTKEGYIKRGAFNQVEQRFGVGYLTARKLIIAANPEIVLRKRNRASKEA